MGAAARAPAEQHAAAVSGHLCTPVVASGVPDDWQARVAAKGQVGQLECAGAQRERAGTASLGAPAQAPQALHRLPAEMAAPIIEAYSDALGRVFLFAAPVAAVGFILALMLKEVPLREIDGGPVDLGEGFGMPSAETPDEILETAVSRLIRDSPDLRLRSLAERPGCDIDVGRLWALVQIYRNKQVFGSAKLVEIAERLRVPYEVIEPPFLRLVSTGYALRTGGEFWLTQDGVRQIDAVSSAIVGRIVEKLGTSSNFEGRPDRLHVEAALERIAHRLLLQQDNQ